MATKKDKEFTPLPVNTQYSKGTFSPGEKEARNSPAGSDKRKTYDLVESQYGPGRTALTQQLSRLGRDKQYDVNVQENFGERHDERLQGIAGLLQDQLGGITDRTQQAYKGASQNIGQAYDSAGKAVEGASDDVLSALAEQMNRLGLTEAGRDPNQMLQQQSTDLSGRHAISGAGATGNIEALGADMTGLAAKTEGDAAQEWGQKRDALGQQVMAAVSEINREYNNTRDEVLSQLGAHESSRGSAMRSTLEEVIENRLERERQKKLDALSEFATREGLAVQRGYLDLSQDRFGLETELGRGNLDVSRGQLGVAQGQLQLQRDNLLEQKRQFEEQLALSTTPEAKAKAQLEIDQIEAQIRNIDAQTMGSLGGLGEGAQEQTRFRGLQGAKNWANQKYQQFGVGIGDALVEEYLQLKADAMAHGSGNELSEEGAMNEMLQMLLENGEYGKHQDMIRIHYIINNQDADFSQ